MSVAPGSPPLERLPDLGRSPQVRAALLTPLERLRSRRRLYLALEGLARLAIVAAACVASQYVCDRWLRLERAERMLISGGIVIVLGVVGYRVLLRGLWTRWSDARLAGLVDRRHPELRDQLTSAVEFAESDPDPDSNSPQLVAAVVAEACRKSAEVPFLDVLNHRRARQRAVELGGFLLAFAAALLFVPEARLWWARNWAFADIPWPQATYLDPDGFDAGGLRRAARGEPLEIVARNRGRLPRTVTLEWRSDSGRSGSEMMTLVGEVRWEAALGLLTEDLVFTLRGGDERTRPFRVTAVDRPQVVRTVVRVTPPDYTRLPPLELEQQTLIEAPAGARLEFVAELNKPVARAVLTGAAGPVGESRLEDPQRVRTDWDAPVAGLYAFELVDADGLDDRRPVRFTLKVLADEAPRVSLTAGGVGSSVTPKAILPLRAEFGDAYGLTGVSLYVQRGEEPPLPLPLSGFEPGQTEFEAAAALELYETLAVQPGQKVRLWAEARDNRPGEANVTRSDPIELKVLSVPDYLAELAERELELRREFERLISEQRGLSDALGRLTPNLTPAEPPTAAAGQQLSGLARRQDGHAERSLALEQSFDDILAEMAINAVERRGEERRISEQIIAPLADLGQRLMPAASGTLGELRRRVEAAALARAPNEQADIQRAMQAILANMLEWEGYREVVALLTDIIEEQNQLREATGAALGSELDAILGLEDPLPGPEATPPPP